MMADMDDSAPDETDRPSFKDELEQARAGDREAWKRVFDRLADFDHDGAALLAIGRRLLPDTDNARRVLDSRDLLQSALRSGWIDASQFRGESEGEFFSWMRQILRRKLAQNTRRKRPLVGLPEGADGPDAKPDARQGHPLSDLVRDETSARLRAAVDQLTDEQKRVIKLRLQGKRSPEIAAILGVTPETVRMRESRAARKLRDLLRGEEE